jgi:hypothetical protein
LIEPRVAAPVIKGLEDVRSVPESRRRDELELELQTALGMPLIATKGYGALETGAAYARALELGVRLGCSEQQLELVARWRSALHSDRLVDQVGQNWFRTIEAQTLLPQDPAPLLPNGQPSATDSLQQFAHMIERQVRVLTTADIFLLMAALCSICS